MDTAEAAGLRKAHREFERARGRVWLDRVKVGLDHRRAMREIQMAWPG